MASMVSTGLSQAVTSSAASAEVLQQIQAHQESAARLSPIDEVRTFLDSRTRGFLSTFSKRYVGYPAGSMVDFACASDGCAILSVSSLSAHTKDLLGNEKCSLLVARDPSDRTDLVVTFLGDAFLVPEKDRVAVRETYLTKHPDAHWVDFGDFQFVRIEPHVVRYVSGVGTALLRSGEFDRDEFRATEVDPISRFMIPIASHMNKDHPDDTRLIVRQATSVLVDSAEIVDLDSVGFYVKSGYKGGTFKLRIPFPRRAVERKDVKGLMVEMLQAARSTGMNRHA